MDSQDFIVIGTDTINEANVPTECHECTMLAKPNVVHPEWYCNIFFSSRKAGLEAKCEDGQIIGSEAYNNECSAIDVIFPYTL